MSTQEPLGIGESGVPNSSAQGRENGGTLVPRCTCTSPFGPPRSDCPVHLADPWGGLDAG